ncbi:CPBP family intramembrane glutamic endopeptidase [Palaeococcus sp. (in: euryarchaeotes)]
MKEFVLYFVNFLIIAGLWEELVFRGLLFASLEERFGGGVALVGNSAIHWLFHFAVGLNVSQFIAALTLSSYRLTFRRIEPLILIHALWDTVFVSLTPRFVGSAILPVLVLPLLGALFSILMYITGEGHQVKSLSHDEV